MVLTLNWIHQRCLVLFNIYQRQGNKNLHFNSFPINFLFSNAKLLDWFRKLQLRYHAPVDMKRYELCITNGSMEGLSKVFELLINPNDPILIDSPCYSGSLDFVSEMKKNHRFCSHNEFQLRGLGADIISIETDSNGMNVDHLSNVLRNWSDLNRFPKALYTIPTGSNPTGVSMNLERKEKIYEVELSLTCRLLMRKLFFFRFRSLENTI